MARSHHTARPGCPRGTDHPLIALVQVGWLVGAYDADEVHDAERAAAALAIAGGHHVDLYEVDPGTAPLPHLGSEVDPEGLGWRHLSHQSA